MSFAFAKTLLYLWVVLGAGFAFFRLSVRQPARRELGYTPLVIFLALTSTVFLAPHILVAHAAFLAAILLLPKKPHQVGLVYLVGLLATPPMLRSLEPGGLYLIGVTLHDTLALGGLARLLFLGKRRRKGPLAADAAALAILVLLVVIGGRNTTFTDFLRTLASIGFRYGVPYYLLTRSLVDLKQLTSARLWLACAGAMLASVAIFETWHGWPLFAELSSRFGANSGGLAIKWRDGWLRAEGPFGDQTVFSFFLVVCLLAAWSCRRVFRSPAYYYAVLLLLTISLIAPQSRGAWFGAGVAALAVVAYRPGRRSITRWSFAALVAAVLGFAVADWNSASANPNDTASYRSRLFTRGLEEWRNNPIFGEDLDLVRMRMQDMVQGEGIVDFVNSYLYFALGAGVIGFIVFLLCFVMSMVRLWSIRKVVAADIERLEGAIFLFALLASCVTIFAFTSFIERMSLFTLFLFGFANNVSGVRRREANVVAHAAA